MYREEIAEKYTYDPMEGLFDIKDSPIQGKGLFVRPFIEIEEGTVYSDRNFYKLNLRHPFYGMSYIEFKIPIKTHLEFNYNEQKYLERTHIGGFINHSDKPNCKIEKVDTEGQLPYNFYTLIALRDVYGGEEITLNYDECEICKM